MSAPLAAGAVCARPDCGHGEDLHDGICFGTACECVRFVGSADVVPVGPQPKPSGGYQPTLPWLALLDEDDRVEFLDELADSATVNASSDVRLAEIERTCATWRLIAEAQHGHNTAPGPDAMSQAFAPVAALREVLDGEHFATVHHDYKGPGRDLDMPATGGA